MITKAHYTKDSHHPEDYTYLSQGKPHIFKMTLDDGFATYQYDINLNENWSMFDIQNKINKIIEKYGGTVTKGRLMESGYLKNEKKNN